MDLANVARLEPTLAVLLEKVLLRFGGVLVVAARHTITADQDFTLRERLVRDAIAAFLPVDQTNVAQRQWTAGATSLHVPFYSRYRTVSTMCQCAINVQHSPSITVAADVVSVNP